LVKGFIRCLVLVFYSIIFLNSLLTVTMNLFNLAKNPVQIIFKLSVF
jgi:hypothetical protein